MLIHLDSGWYLVSGKIKCNIGSEFLGHIVRKWLGKSGQIEVTKSYRVKETDAVNVKLKRLAKPRATGENKELKIKAQHERRRLRLWIWHLEKERDSNILGCCSCIWLIL